MSRVIAHTCTMPLQECCGKLSSPFDHTLCQNYSPQDLFQDSSALKALVFRAVSVEYPSSMLARFRVRERNCLSVRFIFRTSKVRGQPDGFSWLVKNRLTSGQLKTLNSLMCFFASTELLAHWFPRPRRPKKRPRQKIGFVWTTRAMMPVFLRPFENALIIYLPG